MPLANNIEILMIRCIKDEVKAFLSNSKDEVSTEQRKEAESWLFDDNYNDESNAYSLQNICLTLRKNINKLRTRVMVAKHFDLSLSQFITMSESGKLDKLIQEINDGKNKLTETKKTRRAIKRKKIRISIKYAKLSKN